MTRWLARTPPPMLSAGSLGEAGRQPLTPMPVSRLGYRGVWDPQAPSCLPATTSAKFRSA